MCVSTKITGLLCDNLKGIVLNIKKLLFSHTSFWLLSFPHSLASCLHALVLAEEKGVGSANERT